MSKRAAVIVGGLAVLGIVIAASGKKAHAATGTSDLPLPDQPKEDAEEQRLSEEETIRANQRLEEASKSGAPPTELGVEIAKAVANAIATGNPGLVRATAERLKQIAGYQYEDSMLQAAAIMEEELAKTKKRNVTLARVKELLFKLPPPRGAAASSATTPSAAPSGGPTAPRPVSPTLVDVEPKQPEPPVTKPPAAPLNAPRTPEFAAGQVRAAKLALHLQSAKKHQENRALVQEFQSFEQLKPDGMYGPKTALEIASYGVVPPAPFYWPKNWVAAKREYKANLLQTATEYPEKAAEFRAAAERIKV